MKVILLTAVRGLGNIGDVKNVSDGYAQNFLLPKKLAKIADPKSVQQAAQQKSEQEVRKSLEHKESEKLASEIKNQKIVLFRKARNGQLFGSITAKDIQAALSEKGYDTSMIKIHLPHPIKTVGMHSVSVSISNFSSGIAVHIEEET